MALGKKKKEVPMTLAPGVTLIESQHDQDEITRKINKDIIYKAAAAFLLTALPIYIYMTSVGLRFSPVFFVTLAVEAVILAVCYRSKKGENLFAILFLLVFIVAGFTFRLEINSGFYAVVNTTIDRITTYFNITGMRSYTERVVNRYLTVTAFAIAIGTVLEYVLFNLVVWSASYMWCFILTELPNLIIIYINGETNSTRMYSMAVIIVLIYVALVRGGGHYRLNRGTTDFIRTKKGLSYRVDSNANFAAITYALIIWGIGLALLLLSVWLGIYNYQSPIKERTKPAVKEAFLKGADGLMNRYASVGGLNSGKLGGVNRVHQDGQPDLEITFTPYSSDTVYIRNFVGGDYMAYDNYWIPAENTDMSAQVSALKKSYKDGKGAKGRMDIKNVGADVRSYEPYYTDKTEIDDGVKENDKILPPGATEQVTYYPLLDTDDMNIDEKEPGDEYRGVPTDIYKSVEAFCKQVGLTAGMPADEAVEKLRAYFQKNYPYTLAPGATPRDKDFVEYFLDENKKGYCAHYASAAVLIFRSLAIPARYCEGYDVSMENLANNADRDAGKSYDDYYSGENELESSAVVKTTVSDMNAHAWCEIYEKGHGWVVVDVTPSASSDENSGGGFLSDLMSIFNSGVNRTDTTQNNISDNNSDSGMRFGSGGKRAVWFILFLAIILASPAIWVGFRNLLDYIKYRRVFAGAGISDRLILYYQRQADHMRKKNPGFREKVNYEEQLSYRFSDMPSEDREKLKDILNKAGFSAHAISQEEYDWAMKELSHSSRKRRHTASNSGSV